ncbi:MAG: ATP-binding protein [Gammaproteobacteria bacterium]
MTAQRLETRCFPARPAALAQVRRLVRDTGARLRLPAAAVEDMVLAVNEACMNIVQHGYGDNDHGEITLEILTGDNEVVFRLIDRAPRIDPASLRPRPLDEIRPGGLGIHFINSVMDKVAYKPTADDYGNILELHKKIPPEATP